MLANTAIWEMAGEMAQLAKDLQYKREDLPVDPQHPC